MPEHAAKSKPPSLQRRGIYLLPNLFTTCALFAGFYAIVAAMKGLFDVAAIALFVAMIADTLDGRIARLTHTQSAFGAEYDSLSDMVAFGVAPALIMYNWGLSSLGKLGWLAAFIYTATTALRLARFNIQSVPDKRYFVGLPSPAAAGLIATLVWVGHEMGLDGHDYNIMAALWTVLAGGLMVSRFRFYSFKTLDLRKQVPYISVLIILLILAGIALDPPRILLCLFVAYMLSGPILMLNRIFPMTHVMAKIKKKFPF